MKLLILFVVQKWAWHLHRFQQLHCDSGSTVNYSVKIVLNVDYSAVGKSSERSGDKKK